MAELIGIETTRYSTFFRRVFDEFNNNVIITIGESYNPVENETYYDKDIPWLKDNWCTKKNLKESIFFNFRQNGEELFGFFDHPDNMWADISVLPFIEKLAEEKIIRFHIAKKQPSRFSIWMDKIFGKKKT
jgi:hypothetical protein